MQDEMNDLVNPYYKDPDSFVSVVRCKDCKRGIEMFKCEPPIVCQEHGKLFKRSDYCSYGERKERGMNE